MYLKRIEIQGFKSFPARTTFEFGPGVTAIIGPNGSGKSNVADALRWVLGEQNPRAMRLRKIDDALFAGGGTKRPPSGFAEVSMWLDNSSGWLPVAFQEVVVTRRLHRSGDTEYLINRQRVRLRDIHELFIKGRIGQNSYAIMGQGLVDQVLSLRPDERRALLEEAADVRRYRLTIDDARARLSATRDNREKVELLVAEIAPRLGQLERQARRAREHGELARELASALHAWFGHRWRACAEALTIAESARASRVAALAAARDESERLEARLTTARERLAVERRALRAAEERLQALAEQARTEHQRLRLDEERLGFVRRRLEELQSELAALTQERDSLRQTDAAATGADVARLTEARATLEERMHRLRALDGEYEQARRALSDAEGLARRRRGELREVEERLARLEVQRDQVRREGPAAAERRRALLAKLRDAGRRYHERHRQLAQAEAGLSRLDAARARSAEEAEQAREALAQAERDAAAARAAHEEHSRRLEMLRRLQGSLSVDGAAAALRQAAGKGGPPAFLGSLSSVIRVPRGLETAIEAVLEGRLSALIPATRDDLTAAIHLLDELGKGRTTLIDPTPHLSPMADLPGDAPPTTGGAHAVTGISALTGEPVPSWLPAARSPLPGVVAATLVECAADHRPLVDRLLGRVLIVEDLTSALAARDAYGLTAVTRDGTVVWPDGAVTAGRGQSAGRLELERDLAGLPPLVEAAQAARREREAALIAARGRMEIARAAAADAAPQADRLRRTAAGLRETLAREKAALAPVRGDLLYLRRSTAGASERLAALDAEVAALAPRLGDLRRALAGADTAAATVRRESQAVAGRRDDLSRLVADARGVVNAAEREAMTRAALRESRRTALARLEERLAARQREAEGRAREIGEAEADADRLRDTAARTEAARARAEADLLPLRERVAMVTRDVDDLEPAVVAAARARTEAERSLIVADGEVERRTADFDRLKEEMTAEGIDLDRARSRNGHLDAPDGAAPVARPEDAVPSSLVAQLPLGRQHESQELALTRSPLRSRGNTEGSPPSEGKAAQGNAHPLPAARSPLPDPTALQERIRVLRGRIRNLGAVNLQAAEEYRESRERHDFLTAQLLDLQAAEAALNEALDDLLKLAREKFAAAFAGINAGFEANFTRFFGGGAAQLVLDETSGKDDPGVEIVARPPGKRLQSLSLLSGGERAMTAVALLFALLEANPAPFCVLDEVDAALDESNVNRFGDALGDLAQRTQFIVITHNRGTIEAAGTIYGVSMQRDGASSVLSLRIEDVERATGSG